MPQLDGPVCRAPKAGQLQRNPDLANTFKLLGAEGATKGPLLPLAFASLGALGVSRTVTSAPHPSAVTLPEYKTDPSSCRAQGFTAGPWRRQLRRRFRADTAC
jgi:hypothetical protein